MRNTSQATELAQLNNVVVLPLDVTDVAQVEQTVQNVISNYQVDVVFNNAGYGLVGPMETYTDEQMVRQINTNLLGDLRVTKALCQALESVNKTYLSLLHSLVV